MCIRDRIYRDAKDQIKNGRFIDNFSDAKAGDLAFFVNENGLVTHVGIMLSNSKIIHSSGKVRIDSIDENGINRYVEVEYKPDDWQWVKEQLKAEKLKNIV